MSRANTIKTILVVAAILLEILVQASAYAWVISPIALCVYLLWDRYLGEDEIRVWAIVFAGGILLQMFSATNAGVLPLAIVLTYMLRVLLSRFVKSGIVMQILLSLGFLNLYQLSLLLAGYMPSGTQVLVSVVVGELIILLAIFLSSRWKPESRVYV